MVDRQTDEDAAQHPSYHSEKVAKVEVGGKTVQVSGETVLDACSNEPGVDENRVRLYTRDYLNHLTKASVETDFIFIHTE